MQVVLERVVATASGTVMACWQVGGWVGGWAGGRAC